MNKNRKNKQTVTAKVDPDVVKKYEELARINKTTLSAIIDSTLKELVSLATLHSDTAADYIKMVNNHFLDNYKTAPSTNFIVHLCFMNFLAQNRAEVKVFGDLVIQGVHFVFKQNGEPIIGDDLIKHLEAQYVEKFEKIKEMIIKEAAPMDKENATLASILN